jgi:hypothetical protein
MHARMYALVAFAVLAACHRPTEVRGLYVYQDGFGTFFPCDDPNSVVFVPDTALATRYRSTTSAPHQVAYVHLRGVRTRSGSIYSGRPYFVVEQIIEVRPRASGECPSVAPPGSAVSP